MQNINRHQMSWLLCLIAFDCMFLTACFPPNSSQLHRAACNDLKSKIVFNAATSDTRRAEIERALRPLDEYTYDVNCEKTRY